MFHCMHSSFLFLLMLESRHNNKTPYNTTNQIPFVKGLQKIFQYCNVMTTLPPSGLAMILRYFE